MHAKKVRLLAGALAAMMLTGVMAGCQQDGGESSQSSQSSGGGTSTTQSSSEPEEVRDFGGAEVIFGSHWATAIFQEPGNSTEGDLLLQRIEELEEKYHCSFSYVSGSPEEFTTNFATALAAGQKYADFVDTNMYWFWDFLTAGYLEPLDDIADLRINDDTWFPTYTEMTKVGGKSYGVNFHTWYHNIPHAFHVVYFNQNILQSKNLESPYDLIERGEWNWDNFRDLIKKAHDPQNGVYGISSLGDHLERAAIRSNGAREVVVQENGQYTFGLADERTYAALEFVRDIIHTDKTFDMTSWDGRTAGIEWTDTIKSFCDGKDAFFTYHTDCLQFGGFLDSMEDDYGMVPFPKGPSGTSDYNSALTGDTRIYSIPITADDKERSGFLLRKLAQPLDGTAADDWKNTAERKYFRDPNGAQQYFNIVQNADSDYSWITGAANNGAWNNANLAVTRDKAKTPAEAMEGIASSFQFQLDAFLNKEN